MPLDNHRSLKFIQKLYPPGFKKKKKAPISHAEISWGNKNQTRGKKQTATGSKWSASASENFEQFTTQYQATVAYKFKDLVKHFKILQHIWISWNQLSFIHLTMWILSPLTLTTSVCTKLSPWTNAKSGQTMKALPPTCGWPTLTAHPRVRISAFCNFSLCSHCRILQKPPAVPTCLEFDRYLGHFLYHLQK